MVQSSLYMKIIFPAKIDLTEESINKIKLLGAEIFDDVPSLSTLKDRIRDAEIIVVGHYIKIDRDMIDGAPKLKYIIIPTSGYEYVDVEYINTRNIAVLNCPTFNSRAVAEHAISLLMATNRMLLPASDSIRSGVWDPQSLVGYEMVDKKIGLIGYGNIGKNIEKIGLLLGMRVAHINSKSNSKDIDSLVADSDFVILCASSNYSTKNILDKRRLELLKSSSIVINVSRGDLVDQNALYTILKNNKIRGAGIDVFEKEPAVNIFSDRVDPTIIAFTKLRNVITTPHIGYNTKEAFIKRGNEILLAIESCISNNPVNVVNHKI